jgi:hypothetical protein
MSAAVSCPVSHKDAAKTRQVMKLANRKPCRSFVPANCHHASGYRTMPSMLAKISAFIIIVCSYAMNQYSNIIRMLLIQSQVIAEVLAVYGSATRCPIFCFLFSFVVFFLQVAHQ